MTEFGRGDTVALTERAAAPRIRCGACTRAELDQLVVVALKDGTGVGALLKLRTAAHASIGWVRASDVVLVRRAGR